jgi:Glycosyl transferases group 1
MSVLNERGQRDVAPLRVLVGTMEIAGMLPDFADGFRQLGHRVTTAISTKHSFYPHIKYDIELQADVFRGPGLSSLNRAARAARILKLILSHDLFVFIWAGSSLRWGTELPILRALGKRIVWFPCGDDVRHSSAHKEEFSSIALSADHEERLENDPLTRPLDQLRRIEMYSDEIFSVPNQSSLALRPYYHFFVPIDLSKYHGHVPGREVPIIVHAPSLKTVKGTALILPVLERLKSEGVGFELRLLEGMSNLDVLSSLADADVVIDQLHTPLHGKLGVEAMASRCALACGNREDYEPVPRDRPIWHIDPDNLYEQLRRLLTDRELRVRLANEGRSYVERYHDHRKVASRIIERLNGDKTRQQYDHYPRFFAERFKLPKGVTLRYDLQRMSAQIVQRWGLPEGVDPQEMIRRGLMSEDGLERSKPIPRWKSPLRSVETAAC